MAPSPRAGPQEPAIAAVPNPTPTSNQGYDKSSDNFGFSSPFRRASKLSEASFLDNQFEARDLGNPALFVEGADGEKRRPPTDDDQRSRAHGHHSDFRSITTVEDFGLSLGITVQNDRRQTPRGRAPSASEHLLHPNDSMEAERPDGPNGREQNLRGLGDSFKFADGPRVSANQLDEELDEELNEELDKDPDCLKLDDVCAQCKHETHENDDFAPLDELVKLLDKKNIRQILRRTFPGETEKVKRLTHSIFSEGHENSRRLILATLILMDRVSAIEDFVHHDIWDVHLPLRTFNTQILRDRKFKFYKRGDPDPDPDLDPDPNSDPTCFENWTHMRMKLFYSTQYQVLAPFLDMRRQHIHFYPLRDQKMILPFIEWEHKVNGGYGTVWKVRIHQAHHNFDNFKNPKDPNPYFAAKEIKSENYEAYRDEIRVLERFSGPQEGHPHLIRLLIAIQHAKKYYLIFEWADGNLLDLWEEKQLSPSSPEDTRWLIRQCLGMTGGLKKIHDHESWKKGDGSPPGADKNRGRHGDIKPENILFFKSPEDGNYHLVVSDFGLTRFHSDHSVNKVAHDKVTGWSWTYRPPEFDMHSPISQAYDMWSLGCLYLEFVSWFLVGYYETRKTFQDKRLSDDVPLPGDLNHTHDKFFNLLPDLGRLGAETASHREPRVKDSVRDWILYLQGHENCSLCTRDFLEIIKTRLLVPDPLERATSKEFHRRLDHILQSCEKSPGYCVPGSPVARPESPASSKAMMPTTTREETFDHPDSLALKNQILDQLQKSRGQKDQGVLPERSNVDPLIHSSGDAELTRANDSEISGVAHGPESIPLEVATRMISDDHQPLMTRDEARLGMDPTPDMISLQNDETDLTRFASQLSQSGQLPTACTTPALTTQNSEAESSMAPQNVRRASLYSVSQHSTARPTPDVVALANEQHKGLCIQLATPSGQAEGISGDVAVSNERDARLTSKINNDGADDDITRDRASLNPQPSSDELDNTSRRSTTICPEELERTSHQSLCHKKEFEALSDQADSKSTRYSEVPHGPSAVIESGEMDPPEENRNSPSGKRKQLRRWFTRVNKWVCC